MIRLVDATPIENYYKEVLATADENEKSLIKYTGRALDKIKEAETVQAREYAEGVWIIDEKGLYECSICHSKFSVNECMAEPRWNGCPICFSEIRSVRTSNRSRAVSFSNLAMASSY